MKRIFATWGVLLGGLILGVALWWWMPRRMVHPQIKAGSSRTLPLLFDAEEIFVPQGRFTVWFPQVSLDRPLVRTKTARSLKKQSAITDRSKLQVSLSYGFWTWRSEVSQRLFVQVMGYNPSHFGSCPACPVEWVTWHEAVQFANRLSLREGRETCFRCEGHGKSARCQVEARFAKRDYMRCRGYRLPTEAEWLHLAHSHSTTASYKTEATTQTRPGRNRVVALGLVRRPTSVGKTVAVSASEPNRWGLFHVAGNVSEWTYDCWEALSFKTLHDPVVLNEHETYRVTRGGHWLAGGKATAASRNPQAPTWYSNTLGLRIVRTGTPVRKVR